MSSMGGPQPPTIPDASTAGGQGQVIRIVDAPCLDEEPAFGALVVRVPLNETPSGAWLQHFRVNQLPGHAHRAVDGGLVFHLDRNDQDVTRALREIAAAVAKANEQSEALAEADEKAAIKWDSAMNSKREKIDRQMADWWEQQKKQKAADGSAS